MITEHYPCSRGKCKRQSVLTIELDDNSSISLCQYHIDEIKKKRPDYYLKLLEIIERHGNRQN